MGKTLNEGTCTLHWYLLFVILFMHVTATFIQSALTYCKWKKEREADWLKNTKIRYVENEYWEMAEGNTVMKDSVYGRNE